jgi:AI-2 transport protein TqsA
MIWGIMGVILAAPITAIIKIAFEKFETTKPISRFLEGKIHLQED